MYSLDSKHSSKMQLKILFKYPVPKLYGRFASHFKISSGPTQEPKLCETN